MKSIEFCLKGIRTTLRVLVCGLSGGGGEGGRQASAILFTSRGSRGMPTPPPPPPGILLVFSSFESACWCNQKPINWGKVVKLSNIMSYSSKIYYG